MAKIVCSGFEDNFQWLEDLLIYWGHGIYGVEMASKFYFGKHPTLLCLGECAMLVGIIPAPELRSPLRDTSRGKTFQARVLKRMVEVGFLDMETALLVVKQNLNLRVDRPHHGSGLLLPSSSSGKCMVCRPPSNSGSLAQLAN
ncbi:hypothetical protein CsSME_00037522 [Camellia sinensis var. sinensis]